MSKPVKKLIADSYKKRFADVDGAVMIDLRGVAANDNNALRHLLQQQSVHIMVLKNSLAKQAFEGTALQPICELLAGSCALAYGGQSVVDVTRSLFAKTDEIENLQIRGALMEGQIYGPDDVEALSKLPTLEEARAIAVQIILSPGSSLVGAILGPGRQIAGLVDAIKQKLEEGEPIKATEAA